MIRRPSSRKLNRPPVDEPDEDEPVIPPPAELQVESRPVEVLLYDAEGGEWCEDRRIGFHARRGEE